jgi:uncharacterized NAD(P)/FAD-binding protein YdhS
MKTIAVVGAGFSGTALAIQLLRQRSERLRVLLFERRPRFGRGLAYSGHNPRHLLNVRAGRMSAFSDKPNHFVEWLAARYWDRPDPNEFASRNDFGAYLEDILRQTANDAGGRRLSLINDEVVTIDESGPMREAVTENGGRYAFDYLVLATGNETPNLPTHFPKSLISHPYYIGDPWSSRWIDVLDREERVLILGTGLTTVDIIVSLLDRGHKGPIVALSRHGLLPRIHRPDSWMAIPLSLAQPLTARSLTRRIRAGIKEQEAKEGDWRFVIDGVRPHAHEAWQGLSIEERARFLRHIRPWWDVHRHRMAPEIGRRVEKAIGTGQLTVGAGHVVTIEEEGGSFEVTYQKRHEKALSVISAERVVNALGIGCDVTKSKTPLVCNLVERGLLVSDELGIGPKIARDDAMIDKYGNASDWLFGAGPITRSRYWEIVAVPDIRLQIEQLVGRLLAFSAPMRLNEVVLALTAKPTTDMLQSC